VQRYRCRISRRTFSLLPDALVPYHYFTACRILTWLYALEAERVPLNTLAARDRIDRWTLRHLKACFCAAVRILRLPTQRAALGAAAFMRTLAQKSGRTLVSVFRGWKELEPKHSVVGIYPR
jgi:hypothetical protein